MSTGYGEACSKCGKAPFLRFSTDGKGRMAEEVLRGCEHEYHRRRLCVRCHVSIADRNVRAKYCLPCRAAVDAEVDRRCSARARERDPEKVRERGREYMRKRYKENPEREREKRKRAYHRNIEAERKKKREANRLGSPSRAKRDEYAREYRAKNRERLLEQNRQRYQRDREKILAIRKEEREFARLRRAAKARLAAKSGPATAPPEKQQFKEAA